MTPAEALAAALDHYERGSRCLEKSETNERWAPVAAAHFAAGQLVLGIAAAEREVENAADSIEGNGHG